MTRLKSRLDKLDGGALPEEEVPIEYVAIEDRPEWPDDVGDFIWTRLGVFYRENHESPEDFVARVRAESWPPRSLDDLTDDELETSLSSINDLIGKLHPEYREAYELQLEAQQWQP